MRSLPPKMIIGGEGRYFNCVLTNTDCTGNMNFSKALEKIVWDFGLVAVWETVLPRGVYTHYTSHGAARLDLTYVISNVSGQTLGVETVFCGIYISPSSTSANQDGRASPTTRPGSVENEHDTFRRDDYRNRFQQEWTRWRLHVEKCRNMVTWWEKYVKWKTVFFSSKKGLRGLEKIW